MAKVDGNGNYVYPKVPRKYWKAVVMACKIIQEKHAFNVAIDKASKQFDVNPETLKNHVVARTQAGCAHGRAKRAKTKKERALTQMVINPQLPRMLEMPQGYCKDCEFCRVNGKQIQEVLASLKNKAVEIEKAVAEIFADETKSKNVRTSAAKNLVWDRGIYGWTRDKLTSTRPSAITAQMYFDELVNPVKSQVVCTRHSQARINNKLCELAFPAIPFRDVMNGSIGCGEFEEIKNDE